MRGGAQLQLIRRLVCIPLFTFFILPFLGWDQLLTELHHTLFTLQFIPSLVGLINEPGSMLGMGCIAVLAITLCFGRVYCSFLCPLGMLLDLFFLIIQKVGLSKQFVHKDHYRHLQLFILLLVCMAVIMGSNSLLNFFDPLSIFGRITTHLFQPVLIWVNNVLVNILEFYDNYSLSLKKSHFVPAATLLLAMSVFGGLLFLSLFSGRLYCNLICPVGALLGIVSKFAFFKVTIDQTTCKACGLCENMCKSGNITNEGNKIDSARCVTCFNCIATCPVEAIEYRPRIERKHEHLPVSLKRRAFIGLLGGIAYFWLSDSLFTSPLQTEKVAYATPVTPPGSISLSNFTQRCIGCHLCVAGCPTHVLVPSLRSYGQTGLLQPELKYNKGHCLLSCFFCGSVCPTGAILPLNKDEKRQVQIGVVSLNKELCIVHVKKIHCGACGEACPTNAIFPAEKGKVAFPEINNNYCVGCGACELACPTKPKSIVVTSNSVHKQASIYTPPRLPEPRAHLEEDFPF